MKYKSKGIYLVSETPGAKKKNSCFVYFVILIVWTLDSNSDNAMSELVRSLVLVEF